MHRIFNRLTIPSGVWALLLIAAAIGIAIVIYVLACRKYRKTSKLSPSQEETLECFDAQVLSMLSQHGDCMTQQEIRNQLNLPLDIVGEKLLEMEKEGTISRKWLTDDYTFCVQKRSKTA